MQFSVETIQLAVKMKYINLLFFAILLITSQLIDFPITEIPIEDFTP